MKRIYYFLFTTVILVILSVNPGKQVNAVTASPYPFDFSQPDGTTVTIRMMGDEYLRWAETMDHFTLLRNSNDAWEYAAIDNKGDLVPSGLLAHNADDRNTDELQFLNHVDKSLHFSKSQMKIVRSLRAQQSSKGIAGFPTVGTINMLVILIEYADVAFTRTQSDFNNLMYQVNYNGTGSFGQYYYENSYDQLYIDITVTNIYTADYNLAYYGTNTPSDDFRVDELIEEAVYAADPDVDYADFDNDGDGDVDGIYVIYAGYGEEAGGGSDAIWAHASSISWVGLDGVWIGKYACSAELRSNSGTDITGIGVICHEFGHSLGAPDYYDVDYAANGEYDGTGQWDMMASGSWNSDGDIPAHHNAFTKYKYFNWLTPTVISSAQVVELHDASMGSEVVRINTTTSNEYFLCENRQLANFNAALPGHGMLIYHVDEDYIDAQYTTNTINNGAHQGMYPMSATSTTASGIMTSSVSTINTAGCPWPGTSNSTTFDDATTPWSKSWASNNTNTPILDIREVDGVIIFCLNECVYPGGFTADPVSRSQVDLSWTLNSNTDPVLVAVNSNSSFGNPVDGIEYSAGNAIPGGGTVIYAGSSTSFKHTRLNAGTEYFYQAWSVQSGNTYTSANTASATTFCTLITSFPWNEGFENAGNIPSCWTQENLNGSLDWEFIEGSEYGDITSAHTGNYNANLATLSYNYPITLLISPPINLTAISNPVLKFWHTQEPWETDQDELRVYYKTYSSGTWSLLAEYTSSVSTWTERTINLPDATPTYFIAFEGTANAGNGICIDDVEISGAALPFWTGASSSDWNTSGNWLNSTVPTGSSDVIISDVSNNPVVNQAIGSPAICNSLSIQPGGSLTINPGKALTVNGTLTNDAGTSGLVIESDATGTGSLIHSTSDVDATVERYMNNADFTNWQDGWHFLSSPVAGQEISPAFTTDPSSGYDLYCWFEPDNEWVNYKNTTEATTWLTANGSTQFNTGKGYMAAYDQEDTKSFAGKLNVGNVDISGLTITGGNQNRSWHLLGNPFSSAVTWDATAAWNLSNIGGVAKIWNETNQSYSDLSSSPTASSIPATNGFMVSVVSGTGSLTIPAANRSHSAVPFYKSTFPALLLKAISLSEGNAQESRIAVNPLAQEGFDLMFDGEFLEGYAPAFYSIVDGQKYSTNSIPSIDDNTEIPFGFVKNEGSNFRIEIAGTETLETKAFLHDLKTGDIVNIIEKPEYSFTSFEGDSPLRFKLTFGDEASSQEEDIRIFYSQNTLNIFNAEGECLIEVFGMTGQLLLKRQTTDSSIPINLSTGVYMVRVSTQKGVDNVKILVN